MSPAWIARRASDNRILPHAEMIASRARETHVASISAIEKERERERTQPRASREIQCNFVGFARGRTTVEIRLEIGSSARIKRTPIPTCALSASPNARERPRFIFLSQFFTVNFSNGNRIISSTEQAGGRGMRSNREGRIARGERELVRSVGSFRAARG